MLPLLFLLPSSAGAAEARVQLAVPPPVLPGIAAMPRIAHPQDAAGQRVNAALDRLDNAVRKARQQCRGDGKQETSWTRGIEVPMRGPRFLSYVVSDDVDCGGAHPDSSTWAVVYDLPTGQPVDWTALLPRALTGTLSLMTADDGTRTVQLASPRLRALYLAGYDHGGSANENAECKQAVAEASGDAPPPMSAWLDGRRGGLVLQFDLPHAMQACAEPVLIPVAVLRQEGASPDLVEAIEAARR